ncbi:CRISPR-associated protein Cas4 [Deinococcus sp. YIM 77859]|uniref:CRISPR-associated protein Cas4 n=1 Tax=Deinococcus sp. YIM 77859 TaxID=1540221 RepID=UPI000558F117|nr:CRISPR-associated protein Cas4 [Deinococcus sp. YIM 77859]
MPPEPLLLSSLAQYAYCPRRCALVHVEQEWADNIWTVRGEQLHARAHGGGEEARGDVRILRALPLVSRQHRLSGVADVVELRPGDVPYPVEYKSSRYPKTHRLGHFVEALQLCAQALCLEEMFSQPVLQGALYHIASRKRREVTFTPALRQAVLEARDGVWALLESGVLPPPAADDRCQWCSLQEECEPFAPRDFPRGYDPFSTALEEP